ncbi:MAG: integrase family protein, partial [Alphaproteobacteria bacterium]|nr:integrase family protein [Alphaproteobacteria bacterium]
MPRKKLTDLGIENLKAPKIGRIEINDSLIHQLAIRVTAKGQKTFSVRTRINDAYRKQVRITIGTFPAHSVADAREKARDVLLTAQRGIDPNEVKRQERDEAVRERANTVAEVCDIFIKRYAKKKHKHWQKTERTLRNHVVPKWGHKPFREFAASNINDLIDDINDNAGPFAANDILKILKVLMPWAEGRKIIAEAPVLKKIQRTEENERDRYLTESELPSFWAACEAVGYPFGPLFRLLLLTGQRRSEVASMRWSQIDGNDVWTLPSEITKSGR